LLEAVANNLRVYRDRRQLIVLLQGFSSGMPLLLVYSTLSARLAQAGVHRADIGLLLLAQLPYNFKFLWAPLFDRVPSPLPLGRRRGWAITLQFLLMVAMIAMGAADPTTHLGLLAALGVAVAFFSASQDIIVDAFRIELLPPEAQGAGAASYVAGYRVAMLTAGAGALAIAGMFGWFWAYGVMGALMVVGMVTFLLIEEPPVRMREESIHREKLAADYLARNPHLTGWRADWLASLHGAVVCPFLDFITRPGWLAILIFVPLYKLGEAMAGAMSKPFYIDLGFSLGEIAKMSSLVAFVTTIMGGVIGGIIVARAGMLRALVICGLAQSIGNLAYVALGASGHNVWMLALSAAAEDLTGGMAGTAQVAFLSSLTNVPYTATQYALLSALMVLGRSFFTASGGALSLWLGWSGFFLLTTLVTLPALALIVFVNHRWPTTFRDR
jgi:PAT family beta-lactamase induction signal transducer AmpG